MREFVFEVSIFAIVRVRAETEADARQALTSSVFGSPSANEIRLANEANFIEGKEGTITEVDFSIVDNSRQAPECRRGVVECLLTASRLSIEGVLTRTGSATICRANLGTFTPCFGTFTSRSDFPCIH